MRDNIGCSGNLVPGIQFIVTSKWARFMTQHIPTYICIYTHKYIYGRLDLIIWGNACLDIRAMWGGVRERKRVLFLFFIYYIRGNYFLSRVCCECIVGYLSRAGVLIRLKILARRTWYFIAVRFRPANRLITRSLTRFFLRNFKGYASTLLYFGNT